MQQRRASRRRDRARSRAGPRLSRGSAGSLPPGPANPTEPDEGYCVLAKYTSELRQSVVSSPGTRSVHRV
jgi:hypothetical protein